MHFTIYWLLESYPNFLQNCNAILQKKKGTRNNINMYTCIKVVYDYFYNVSCHIRWLENCKTVLTVSFWENLIAENDTEYMFVVYSFNIVFFNTWGADHVNWCDDETFIECRSRHLTWWWNFYRMPITSFDVT